MSTEPPRPTAPARRRRNRCPRNPSGTGTQPSGSPDPQQSAGALSSTSLPSSQSNSPYNIPSNGTASPSDQSSGVHARPGRRRCRSKQNNDGAPNLSTSTSSLQLNGPSTQINGSLNAAAPVFVPRIDVSAPEFVPGRPVVIPAATIPSNEQNCQNGQNSWSVRRLCGGRQRNPQPQPQPPHPSQLPTQTSEPRTHTRQKKNLTLRTVRSSTSPPRALQSTAPTRRERIHEDLINAVLSCTICLENITPRSPLWSGCPACGSVTHFSCAASWANTSSGDEFPCPCCTSKILKPFPVAPRCWCGREERPENVPGLPVNSCGQTCGKEREGCPHACAEVCHAAGCPPCGVKRFAVKCDCGKETREFPCGGGKTPRWQCATECDKVLACRQHMCKEMCHAGSCSECRAPIGALCYCGKTEGEMACGESLDVRGNVNFGQVPSDGVVAAKVKVGEDFIGVFSCNKVCGRKFKCGVHKCVEVCHTGDCSVRNCPLSPSEVTTCPCGKKKLSSMRSHVPRTFCQDQIPTCLNTCSKLLPCGHLCRETCHEGPCAPCTLPIGITCRCHRETKQVICHENTAAATQEEEFTCEKRCGDELSCTKHICKVICCPVRLPPALRTKRKNSRLIYTEVPAAHQCTRICTTIKNCGVHECGQICHSGECLTCLEADMEDQYCPCGRTLWRAPVPCGARVGCDHNCNRALPCGHRVVVEHPCHYDDVECPPCPVRIEKQCMCGKKVLKNMLCGGKVVSCGLPCGKELPCGHKCQKLCHKDGECQNECSQLCMQLRTICGHACRTPCHGATLCPEEMPCRAPVVMSCTCSGNTKDTKCLASTTNTDPASKQPLKCASSCGRLDRAKAFAAALGITKTSTSDDMIPFPDAALNYFAKNPQWALTQEEVFRTFIKSSEQRLAFKPMPALRRAFLHAMAEAFGVKSESVDREPLRSVRVLKGREGVLPGKSLRGSWETRERLRKEAKKAVEVLETDDKTEEEDRNLQLNTLVIKNVSGFLTIDEIVNIMAPAFATCDNLYTHHLDPTTSTLFLRMSTPSSDTPSLQTLRHLVSEIITAFSHSSPTETTGLSTVIVGLAQTTESFSVTFWDPNFPSSPWPIVQARQEKAAVHNPGVTNGLLTAAVPKTSMADGFLPVSVLAKGKKKRIIPMSKMTKMSIETQRKGWGFSVLETLENENGLTNKSGNGSRSGSDGKEDNSKKGKENKAVVNKSSDYLSWRKPRVPEQQDADDAYDKAIEAEIEEAIADLELVD